MTLLEDLTVCDGRLLPTDHRGNDVRGSIVGGHRLLDADEPADTQRGHAVQHLLLDSLSSIATPDSSAVEHLLPADQEPPGTQGQRVGGEPSCTRSAIDAPTPSDLPPIACTTYDRDGWMRLRLAAEGFHNAQQARIRENNRLRVGWKEDAYPPELVAIHQPMLDAYAAAEKAAKKALLDTYRKVVPPSIRTWQSESPGIGDHMLARLLGIIGDPIIKVPHMWVGEGADRVLLEADPEWRTVSQLWSYCGHGDPTRRRTKGMTADEAFALGSPQAKAAVWGIVTAVIKTNRGPYRAEYDAAKERYADREDWTPGHRNGAAIRLAGKVILRDLWRVRHAEVTS